MNLNKIIVVALVALCIDSTYALDPVQQSVLINQQMNDDRRHMEKVRKNLYERANNEHTGSKIYFSECVEFCFGDKSYDSLDDRPYGLLIVSTNSVTLYWINNAFKGLGFTRNCDYKVFRNDIDISKISAIKRKTGFFYTSLYLINSDNDLMLHFYNMSSSKANCCVRAIANTRSGIQIK